MAGIKKEASPFGDIEAAELSAWKRMPATRALLKVIDEGISGTKELYWQHGNPANFDGVSARATVRAYEAIRDVIKEIP